MWQFPQILFCSRLSLCRSVRRRRCSTRRSSGARHRVYLLIRRSFPQYGNGHYRNGPLLRLRKKRIGHVGSDVPRIRRKTKPSQLGSVHGCRGFTCSRSVRTCKAAEIMRTTAWSSSSGLHPMRLLTSTAWAERPRPSSQVSQIEILRVVPYLPVPSSAYGSYRRGGSPHAFASASHPSTT